jgi:PEGA domain
MRALLCFLLSVSLFPLQSQQTQSSPANAQSQGQAAPPTKPPLAFGLEDGTPVKLRITRTISSEDARVGDVVDFEVLEEIKSHDAVLIPRGGIAWATVTEAQSKRRMGRAGKLNINIDNVKILDGEKVPLRAVKEVKGGSHVGAMTGAIVATSIVFFPAAPLFLLVKGKDITIPKGTEITAYINGDIPLDPGKFQSQDSTASAPASPAVAAPSSIGLNSNPDGAEISVDGKYVGNTPSTLHLLVGDHAIRIEKQGYRIWERTLTITPGQTTTITSNLEKQ